MSRRLIAALFYSALAATLASASAAAQPERFATGPLIEDFGPVAEIETDFEIPADAVLRHSFDFAEPARPGETNRSLESAARFLNMHAAAGIPADNMQLALVVHGGAVRDVTRQAHYETHRGGENANIPLIAALLEQNVRIIVCGQSAAFYGVDNEDLLPGVEMALSAMTAHALLQQDDYTLNPF